MQSFFAVFQNSEMIFSHFPFKIWMIGNKAPCQMYYFFVKRFQLWNLVVDAIDPEVFKGGARYSEKAIEVKVLLLHSTIVYQFNFFLLNRKSAFSSRESFFIFFCFGARQTNVLLSLLWQGKGPDLQLTTDKKKKIEHPIRHLT